MTEEQFIVADCSTCIFNKVTKEEYVCIDREEAFLVCNKLNALCKEKEELLDERNYFERKKCEYFNKWNNAHLDNIQLRQENKQLKSELLDIEEGRDYYKSKASSLEEGYIQLQDREIRLKKENEQLKAQIKIYEIFLDGNDLDIEWDLFCIADKCEYSDEDFEEGFDCKDCEYMRWIDD